MTRITGTFNAISRRIFLGMRMFQARVVEKIKTHIWFPVNFSLNLAIYDTVWEKCGGAGQATGDNIVWRIRIACWVTKTTNKLS